MASLSMAAGDMLRKFQFPDKNRNLNALGDFGQEQIDSLRQFDENRDALLDASVQGDREEQGDRAREQSESAFANISGQLERRQRALGLNLTDRQRKSQVRNLGLTRAISRASAVTSANRTSSDIAKLANRAGTGLGEDLLSLEASGLTQLANAEGQRNIREARRKAEKKAGRNALIGNVIGIGMGFA